MADCVITGEILDANNQLAPGIRIHCVRLIGPDLITNAEQKLIATSDEDGLVSFTLPQGSTAYLSGNFFVNGTSFNVNDGVALSIPAASTADLIDLAAVASFPDDGANVQSSGVALATKIGTFNFGAGLTTVQSSAGVASIVADIASAEAVRDTLVGFFVDDGAYNWDVSDALDRVSLVIAPATSSVNGLMSAADKTAFDLIGPRNAASGYAGLSAGGLLTESQIPSSIARDSEVTALTDALTTALTSEIATRGGADTTLQSNITAEASARATADALLLIKASNLSDLANPGTARTNLGLGTLATQNGTFSGTSSGTNTGDQVLTSILASSISDGDLTHAPDGNSVFDALALKANTSSLAAIATSGSAADLSAGILATARGGTGIAFFTAAGPTVARVYTFPDAAATIARTDAAQSFTGLQTFASSSLGVASATSLDTALLNPTGNVIEQRSGTNAQSLLVYNTYTNASNYERGMLAWNVAANRLTVGVSVAGTGTMRPLDLIGSGIQIKTSAGTAWEFNSTGHLMSGADNTFDIGALGATRPRNVFVGGYVSYGRNVVAKTGNYSVAAADKNNYFTNTGAAGEVDFTLPTAVAGLTFTFYVSVAQVLKIIAGASTTIRVAELVTAAAGNIQNATVGGCVRLVAVSATSWVAESSVGTWT